MEDVYSPELIRPDTNDYYIIKVADNGNFPQINFYDFDSFLNILNDIDKVYSSQVHPVLVSALLGKPCKLYQKDFRADDFKYFASFKLDMSTEDSLSLRLEAQNNIIKFASQFFQYIKMFL